MKTSAGSPPSTDPLAPWRADAAALIPVRVTPGARHAGLTLAADANGAHLLRVSVTEPPEDGRANAAVVALVARAAGCAKSALSVQRGASSRNKLLRWDRGRG
ncbi:MAG: DUF167 domain-containing protein [Rubrimonas sp.]